MNWIASIIGKIRLFMYGRRGGDQLGLALIVLTLTISVVLMIISFFIPVGWFQLLSWIPLIYAVYRALSRRLEARHKENRWFLSWWSPLAAWIRQRNTMVRESKTYKHFKCGSCKRMLKVPKGKGKIQIKCPKCGHIFVAKT